MNPLLESPMPGLVYPLQGFINRAQEIKAGLESQENTLREAIRNTIRESRLMPPEIALSTLKGLQEALDLQSQPLIQVRFLLSELTKTLKVLQEQEHK